MIQIQLYKPMETRPCCYCLSLQGGAAFSDFNIDIDKCLYLVRISFDGYGCCRIQSEKKPKKINREKNMFQSFRFITN